MSFFQVACPVCGELYWAGVVGTRPVAPPHVCPALGTARREGREMAYREVVDWLREVGMSVAPQLIERHFLATATPGTVGPLSEASQASEG